MPKVFNYVAMWVSRASPALDLILQEVTSSQDSPCSIRSDSSLLSLRPCKVVTDLPIKAIIAPRMMPFLKYLSLWHQLVTNPWAFRSSWSICVWVDMLMCSSWGGGLVWGAVQVLKLTKSHDRTSTFSSQPSIVEIQTSELHVMPSCQHHVTIHTLTWE